MPRITKKLLDSLHLAHGGHSSRSDGMCVMEAVAWLADLEHSDHPICVARPIRDAAIRVNDSARFDERQKLKPLIKLMMNTALLVPHTVTSDGHIKTYMLQDPEHNNKIQFKIEELYREGKDSLQVLKEASKYAKCLIKCEKDKKELQDA